METYRNKEALIAKMTEGDSRCSIRIGERVRKIVGENRDVHMVGDIGEVKGNIYAEGIELYLVHFDQDADNFYIFILGLKIEKI